MLRVVTQFQSDFILILFCSCCCYYCCLVLTAFFAPFYRTIPIQQPHKRHQHLLLSFTTKFLRESASHRIVSKSRLSKHAFSCGFLCVPHVYVNVNVIAFQQNEHESRREKKDPGKQQQQ